MHARLPQADGGDEPQVAGTRPGARARDCHSSAPTNNALFLLARSAPCIQNAPVRDGARRPLPLLTRRRRSSRAVRAQLRHRLVKSDSEDFLPGTRFQRVLPDTTDELAPAESVRKLVLCSGKVYFDLLAAREKAGATDVAIARVEQISPFPFDLVQVS